MKKILAFLGLLSCFAGQPAAAGDVVVITTADGQKVSYELSDRPVLTFADGQAVFTAAGATVSYPLTDYVECSFVITSPTGVEALPAPDVKAAFRLEGRELTVTGLKAGTAVQVYALSGRLAATARADAGGTARLSLAGLQGSTCVVRAGSVNFKILVQ